MRPIHNRQRRGPGKTGMFRIYQIDSLVRNGKYPNVPKLARRLEVSPRTIEKDIDDMRNFLGASLCYCRKRRGYYYDGDKPALPPLALTEGETVALFLGQKLLTQYRGTPYEELIRFAFEKISAMLPECVSVNLELFDRAVSFDVEPVRGEESLLLERYNSLICAIAERRSVVIDYYSAGRNAHNRRMIDPYHLRYHQGAWYLIGYCHTRREVRIFALDRMEGLEKTEANFRPDPKFSVERYFGDSLSIERGREPVEVKILFDRHQARWICERCWHESQRLERRPDGSVELSMIVSGLGEVKRWALSFGCHAKVLAPPELREEVEREIKEMAEKY